MWDHITCCLYLLELELVAILIIKKLARISTPTTENIVNKPS
jgi:hypothetical protein